MSHPLRLMIFRCLYLINIARLSTDLTPSLEGLRFDDFFGSNADAATADAVAITTAATAGAATARPVHIDVGCARGRCSELLAHRYASISACA